MTTIRDLRPGNPEARARLMERLPEAPADFDRAALVAQLPMILESALDLILEDFEAEPGMTQSSAVGCRSLAAVIDRLQD
jgi:hypothetical protein